MSTEHLLINDQSTITRKLIIQFLVSANRRCCNSKTCAGRMRVAFSITKKIKPEYVYNEYRQINVGKAKNQLSWNAFVSSRNLATCPAHLQCFSKILLLRDPSRGVNQRCETQWMLCQPNSANVQIKPTLTPFPLPLQPRNMNDLANLHLIEKLEMF